MRLLQCGGVKYGRPVGRPEGVTISQGRSGRSQTKQRTWVAPGQTVGTPGDVRAGALVTQHDGQLLATAMGYLQTKGGEASVQPVKGGYMPSSGDLVIAYVSAVMNNMWILDVGGPFDAILPMSLAPWKVEYGDARRHMDVGEAVLARVQEVDETHRVVGTMKGMGLRKLASGYVERVPQPAVSVLMAADGRLLARLKEASECRIIVAHNGRVWIDGDATGIQWAREALGMIGRTATIPGLQKRLGEMEQRAPTTLLEEE